MTKYRLKDQELQRKLDEISGGGFTEALRSVKNPSCIVFQARNGGPAMSIMLTSQDIEPFLEYNPDDWNAYPEVTPPEGVLMRVEIKYPDGDVSRACSIFKDEVWWEAVNGEPIDEEVTSIGKVKRFRPWE